MTNVQKRVYMVILRALFIIMHYIFHHEPGTEQTEGTKIKRDITELLIMLEKNDKRGKRADNQD